MCSAVTSLHLTQPQSSIPGSSLCGLSGEYCSRSPGPGVHLVEHHVFELLVEHRSHVDVRLDGLSRDARSQHVLAVVRVARAEKYLTARVHAVARKGRAVLQLAVHQRRFA